MAYKITLFDTEVDCIGTGVMSLDYISFLLSMAQGQDVEVDISSCGGSHFDAVAIYHLLKPLGVDTNCLSVAGSAAATIFLAGKKRTISKYGLLMIHPASSISAGTAQDMASDAVMVQKCTDNVIQIISDVTKMSIEDAANLVNSTTWLNAEEALALGFATHIEDFQEEENVEVANASLVLNKLSNAPTKYKQVINHILKQPETAPKQIQMTQEEIDAIVSGNRSVLDKVKNFFNAATDKVVTNKGQMFFVGTLKKGTPVFNSGELDTPLSDGDVEVENAADPSKKVKMTVKDGKVENLTAEEKSDMDDDDMDDEECDADNKAVLNSYGIKPSKKAGAKKVMNAAAKKLAEVTNKFNQASAELVTVKNQLAISNAAVQEKEIDVRNKIITEFSPANSQRQSRSTETEKAPSFMPAEGTLAANAVKQTMNNAKKK